MSRKILCVAFALLVVGGAFVWTRPPQEPPRVTLKPPEPSDDPELRERFLRAYRATLAENAPPGMLELLSGAGPREALPPPTPHEPTPPLAARLEPPVLPVALVAPKAPRRPLPYTGTFAATLDAHRTLTLPAPVREQLGGTDIALLTPGDDGCLWLVDGDGAERLASNLARAAGAETAARRAQRLYFAQTERAAVDGAGRLTLPTALAIHAGLVGDVVVIGAGDRLEVWDARRWRAYGWSAEPPTVADGEAPPLRSDNP